MGAELLPCPMCGCAATFVKHSAGVQGTQGFDKWDAVACKHCRTTVGACDRRFRCREDAAEAWNRRVPQSALESERQAHAAEVERLRADAARWDYVRHHWSNAQFRWNNDAANSLKSFTLTIKAEHWTSGANDIEREIDQAIARGTK